ncbi:MAG: substrate-binding domain-containing protein [Clostridia bacterium]|nr:substrate-binding domain-containing protein [Deltaproteobacteria bacterium]
MVTLYEFNPAARTWVGIDDVAAGRMSARELLDRGFTHFAFCGLNDHFSHRRFEGFTHELGKSGHVPTAQWLLAKDDKAKARKDMKRFLLQAHKPLGLFVADDLSGRWIAEICRESGLQVPEAVAILGMGNDDLLCDLAQPSLSSIEIPWRAIGFSAAQYLNQILHGENVGSPPLQVPTRVVTRRSTDTLAVGDPDVAAALRFLREHFHEDLGIDDLIAPLALTRRSLERRFRAALGRSPLEELQRIRVDRAKHLLAESDLSIDQIATACGFAYPHWMAQVFRKHTGSAPNQWRFQFRERPRR